MNITQKCDAVTTCDAVTNRDIETDRSILADLVATGREKGFSAGLVSIARDLLRSRNIDEDRQFYGTTRSGETRLFTRRKKARRRKADTVLCGAKTRRGTPCRCLPVEGRTRCRFHGGLSTGPRTAEGRARIAESNRRRAKDKGVTP